MAPLCEAISNHVQTSYEMKCSRCDPPLPMIGLYSDWLKMWSAGGSFGIRRGQFSWWSRNQILILMIRYLAYSLLPPKEWFQGQSALYTWENEWMLYYNMYSRSVREYYRNERRAGKENVGWLTMQSILWLLHESSGIHWVTTETMSRCRESCKSLGSCKAWEGDRKMGREGWKQRWATPPFSWLFCQDKERPLGSCDPRHMSDT